MERWPLCVTPLPSDPSLTFSHLAGLTGFALFVSISGIFLSLFLMFVPVIYEKYDKFARLARALQEIRVGFILTATGCTFSLLIACVAFHTALTSPFLTFPLSLDSSPPSQHGQNQGAKMPTMIPMHHWARILSMACPHGAARRKPGAYSSGSPLVIHTTRGCNLALTRMSSRLLACIARSPHHGVAIG